MQLASRVQHPPSSKGQQAFLLVESAISLGIIAATLIPLLGLFAVSMSILQGANADTRSSLIAQQWIAQAQMTPFSQLDDISTQWLDDQGSVVPATEAVYEARMEVTPLAGGVLDSPSAARVTVRISGRALQHREQLHSITIANLGD